MLAQLLLVNCDIFSCVWFSIDRHVSCSVFTIPFTLATLQLRVTDATVGDEAGRGPLQTGRRHGLAGRFRYTREESGVRPTLDQQEKGFDVQSVCSIGR